MSVVRITPVPMLSVSAQNRALLICQKIIVRWLIDSEHIIDRVK